MAIPLMLLLLTRISLILIATVAVVPSASYAVTAEVAVPSALTDGTQLTGDFTLSVSGFNGLVLGGQSVTLDLLFADPLLARLGLFEGSISFLLYMQTNTSGAPGEPTATTLFMLDSTDTALSPLEAQTILLGPGTFVIGTGALGALDVGATAVDIGGLRFTTTLPNTGLEVTGANLRIQTNLRGPGSSIQFGTAAQLPEPSTLALLALSLVGIAAARRRVFRL